MLQEVARYIPSLLVSQWGTNSAKKLRLDVSKYMNYYSVGLLTTKSR